MTSNPFADAILSGQMAVALPVAALAGLVSFLSPCVLPLVPGYLGYVGGVAEGLTDFVDRLVEPVVEIHERVRGPECLLKFLSTDDLARALKQHGQHLKGLLLKPDSQAALAQFASPKIQLEHPKTEPPANLIAWFHDDLR